MTGRIQDVFLFSQKNADSKTSHFSSGTCPVNAFLLYCVTNEGFCLLGDGREQEVFGSACGGQDLGQGVHPPVRHGNLSQPLHRPLRQRRRQKSAREVRHPRSVLARQMIIFGRDPPIGNTIRIKKADLKYFYCNLNRVFNFRFRVFFYSTTTAKGHGWRRRY